MRRLLYAAIVLSSCAVSHSHVKTINGEKLLVGPIQKRELFREFPLFAQRYNDFQPDSALFRRFTPPVGSVHVLVFLGTWCGDTKRHLPPFLKTVDNLGTTRVTYQLIAMDRTKKDEAGLAAQYGITRVPTMVFLRNNAEIGRIVEHPVRSVDEDTYDILSRN